MNIYKKIMVSVLLIYVSKSNCNDSPNSQNGTDDVLCATVNAKEHSKLKFLLLSFTEEPSFLQLAKVVKFDLEFTDQMSVELKKTKMEPDGKILKKLFQEGVSLCGFLQEECISRAGVKHKCAKVVIKEPSSGQVIFNKQFYFDDKSLVYDSHVISDDILPILTGQSGPMLSTLAYCKQLSNKCKALCIADYACRQEKILYTSRRINLAPRWHTKAPVLFFSQITKENSRLMSIDLSTNKLKIVCPYDGLSMQPSFSEDGSRAVLCMSGKKNSELYLYDQTVCKKIGKKMFTQLTDNGENNVSPCYLPNNDVIFCSDFETGQPQIYYLDTSNKKTKRITNGKGYCAAPSYCKKNNSIVFCRLVNGYFQLFTISLNDKKRIEKQVTFDNASKQEPAWSECGKYIVFSMDYLHPKCYINVPQIAILNLVSKKIKVVTYDDKPKSFPCWTGKTYYS